MTRSDPSFAEAAIVDHLVGNRRYPGAEARLLGAEILSLILRSLTTGPEHSGGTTGIDGTARSGGVFTLPADLSDLSF
jgi:hypothetical protein